MPLEVMEKYRSNSAGIPVSRFTALSSSGNTGISLLFGLGLWRTCVPNFDGICTRLKIRLCNIMQLQNYISWKIGRTHFVTKSLVKTIMIKQYPPSTFWNDIIGLAILFFIWNCPSFCSWLRCPGNENVRAQEGKLGWEQPPGQVNDQNIFCAKSINSNCLAEVVVLVSTLG